MQIMGNKTSGDFFTSSLHFSYLLSVFDYLIERVSSLFGAARSLYFIQYDNCAEQIFSIHRNRAYIAGSVRNFCIFMEDPKSKI